MHAACVCVYIFSIYSYMCKENSGGISNYFFKICFHYSCNIIIVELRKKVNITFFSLIYFIIEIYESAIIFSTLSTYCIVHIIYIQKQIRNYITIIIVLFCPIDMLGYVYRIN